MFSSDISTGTRTFRTIAILAAAVLTSSATSAFASTMVLTGGDPGEGLTLNSADVLVATTAIAGTSETVQSVTFTVPTGSTPTATNTANGVTVTISAPNTLSGSFTYPGDESMPPTNPSTPNDNALKALMDNISFNNGGTNPPMIISVSGLAHNTQYTIDLLESSIGYGARTQYVSFSDSTPTETVNLGHSDGYDTNDVITSDNNGDLTVTVSSDPVNTDPNFGQAAVFSAFAISGAVPEPASLSLLAVGGLGLLARRRRIA